MLKDTLLYLAQSPRMQHFMTHNQFARKAARRFVAGEQLDDAIKVTQDLNTRQIRSALDFLGENVTDEKEARSATQDYIRAIDLIQKTGVDANISIKLTALGLDISQSLCEENLRAILERAKPSRTFVCIDMEGSLYTERTIDLTVRMHGLYEHVGTVIQSYLMRSRKDIELLVSRGIRVRLVKGAYKENRSVAYQQKNEVDRNYVEIMKALLMRGNYPAIATHDHEIIDATRKFARMHGISRTAFEFQMLYGIRRDLQEKLVQQGYNVRVYVPYGSHWYPYLMRRLAERPANLMFIASHALR